MLASPVFAASVRLQQILRYLVEETMAGRGRRINQNSIAIDVLGRDAQFDPTVDSLVRVDAGRLRVKLREYYQELGTGDRVRFNLPKGHYCPQITLKAPDEDVPHAAPGAPAGPDQRILWRSLHAGIMAFVWPRVLLMLVIGAVTAALVIAGVNHGTGQNSPSGSADRVSGGQPARVEQAGAVQGERSVAVLPFSIRSASGEDLSFFADGLHDDVLTQLSKLAGIKVISRTSVMRYRDAIIPIPQIAKELGVQSVLEGSIRRVDDRIRINVQLIDGRTDEQLWAESFDRDLNMADLFEIQRRITVRTATALQSALVPLSDEPLEKLPTESLEAYRVYEIGRRLLEKRTDKALTEAAVLFQRAIDHDPGFARAYVGLAEVCVLSYYYGGKDRSGEAGPLIERALALDNRLGEAYAVLGLLRQHEGDYDSAQTHYEQAIELNPNSAKAYRWYSILAFERLRDRDKGLALMQHAVNLDPLSPVMRTSLGADLVGVGRTGEGLAEFRKALDLEPGYATAYWSIGMLYATAYDRPVESMRWLRKAVALNPKMPLFATSVAMTYFRLGDFDATRQWMKKLEERGYLAQSKVICALLANALGDDGTGADCAQQALSLMHPSLAGYIYQMLFVLRNADLKAGDYVKALDRYARWYPGLLEDLPDVHPENYRAAVDLALVLQKMGRTAQANRLLQQSLLALQSYSRRDIEDPGYGISVVEIHALQGDTGKALNALRQAIDAGWWGFWWRVPQQNPNLAVLDGDRRFSAMLEGVQTDLKAKLEQMQLMEPLQPAELSPAT